MQAHNIVLSLPYMANLHSGDLKEAMDLGGLVQLRSFRNYGPLRNVNGAWAGMGLSVCEQWQDIERCDEEEDKIEYKLTLSLTYTYDELVVDIMLIQNAYYIIAFERVRFPDLSCGTWDSNRSNTTYLDLIGEKIVEVYSVYDRIDKWFSWGSMHKSVDFWIPSGELWVMT